MTEQNPSASTDNAGGAYRVFARKYRPTDFSSLIGQEALVRTLTNAIRSGRVHHAFILTGVRGVGKTTTARIIARALNCVGPDGQGGPTAEPCGLCENCVAIAEDRHVDVMEMDAASRTGVDDIRELIEGARYRPVSARFKVYIIDEVHMLSKNAFNALLKTLEEPPEHVKFVFATTEIRKVPVTVLSRCMRFDLRRVDTETLARHFAGICDREGAKVDAAALGMIARAADGSVRDGLSLLDQAISHASGPVDDAQVRAMLGLADRAVSFDLFDAAMAGNIARALDTIGEQYRAGADPVRVIEDLLDLAHWLTRVKIAAEVAKAPGVPEMERVRGLKMADGLSMAALTRAWQMLLKGLGEARIAPNPEQAAEMILIRLAYAANLPDPADLAERLRNGADGDKPTTVPCGPESGRTVPAAGSRTTARAPSNHGQPIAARIDPLGDAVGEPGQRMFGQALPAAGLERRKPDPETFDAVVNLATEAREARLRHDLTTNVRVIRFEPGFLEFSPTDRAAKGLARDLTKFLNDHTDRRWVVNVKDGGGGATIKETRDAEKAALHKRAVETDIVKAVLETFPEAVIENVRPAARAIAAAPPDPEEGDGHNPPDDAPALD